MRAWVGETNRLNRERRGSGESDRKELAAIKKKIATMISVIEDGGYVKGMMDRLRELEAQQDELNERLATVPAVIPNIHPHIAGIYRRKVARLADALQQPEERDTAASAIRGLVERIVLTPGPKWADLHATLHGDLGTILEWTGNGAEKEKTDIPGSGMSVSVVAGAGFKRHSGAGGPPSALRMDSGAIGIFILARMALVNAVLRAGGARPREGRQGGRRCEGSEHRRRPPGRATRARWDAAVARRAGCAAAGQR